MTQGEALAVLKTGANIFLTGEPGSGKTHTVHAYVAYLRSHDIEHAITASTGIAATHIGGVTIHSWSGIGVKPTLTDHDIEMLEERESLVSRIRRTKVLIIDEVSMLSAAALSSVDRVCRAIRRIEQPFGGLQIVLVGDFFQLPPIAKQDEDGASKTAFAFHADVWKAAQFLVCYLSEQHRQEDMVFLQVLTAIRRGDVTAVVHETLSSRLKIEQPQTGMTKLFPRNVHVDELNDAELLNLPGDSRNFRMEGYGAPTLVAGLKRTCLSPELLILKVGAKVMFTKNNAEGGYVNGTTGEVIGFSKVNTYPLVQIRGGRIIEAEPKEWAIQDGTKVLAKIVQLPLRLAWAITVHKSQGMSLDAAVVDLSGAFEYGQGYVALSRVRSLAGLYLEGYNNRALEIHPDVAEEDEVLRQNSEKTGEVFAAMDPEDLLKMQHNFIRACGGTVEPHQKKIKPKKDPTVSTYDLTLELLKRELTLEEIAKERGMTVGTIVSHVEKLLAEKRIERAAIVHMKPDEERFAEMKKAFEKVYQKDKEMKLAPVRHILGEKYSFDELRFARLFIELDKA